MATPMVSGAIAALQSYYTVDNIDKIESILEKTGILRTRRHTNLQKPEIMLDAAMNELERIVPAGEFVWMADTWGDRGREPDPATSGKSVSQSPFVWVKQNGDCDASPHEHRNPEFGIENYICVMIRNSGRAQARGKIEVYMAKANLSRSGSWTQIGPPRETTIPPRSALIPAAIVWDRVPEPGHYCLLVRWCPESGCSKLTLPGGIDEAVRNSNDLIWKNVTIVDASRYSKSLDFYIEQDDRNTVNMVVNIKSLGPAELDELGEMIVRLGGDPETILQALQGEPTSRYYYIECLERECEVVIPLKPGVYYMPNVVVTPHKKSKFSVEFRVYTEQMGKLKEKRLPTTLLVELTNIQDVARHKQGSGGNRSGNSLRDSRVLLIKQIMTEK